MVWPFLVITVRTKGEEEEEEEEEGKKRGHAGEREGKRRKKKLAKSTFNLPCVNSLFVHVASTNLSVM